MEETRSRGSKEGPGAPALDRNAALLASLRLPDATRRVLSFFLWLSETPRVSGHLDAIRGKIAALVSSWPGCSVLRDAAGNLLLRKDADPGHAGAPSVCFQAHLDMVASKNADSCPGFDFARDPIRVAEADGFLKAEGTTLGADNGIGMAACLALLSDPALAAEGTGPIECLFTADEETTMSGAAGLARSMREAVAASVGERDKADTDADTDTDTNAEREDGDAPFIRSRLLVNVDSEEAGSICTGCAGCFEIHLTVPAPADAVSEDKAIFPSGESVEILVRVYGLTGGHSGISIGLGRANSHAAVLRLVASLADLDPRLLSVEGGTAPNSIPRDTTARILVEKDAAHDAVRTLRKEFALLVEDYGATDPNMALEIRTQPRSCAPAPHPRRPYDRSVLGFLCSLPDGPLRFDPHQTWTAGMPAHDMAPRVETSICFSVIRPTDDGGMELVLLARSCNPRQLAALRRRIALACGSYSPRLCGAAYPPWEPKRDSRCRALVERAMRAVTGGRGPRVYSVHAGLECGLLVDRCPYLDCASIGPTIEGAHSPDERLRLDTVEPFYLTMVAIVRDLATRSGQA